MTNKQGVLKMSLLPLAIIIILILGVGYFLLKGEIKLPKFNRGPQIKRITGFPTTVPISKEMDKQRKILKSEAELDQFLNEIDEGNTLSVKDKINWDKEYVIAVSTSTNQESGHRIKIKKVYEDKEKKSLKVMSEETEMGQYCDVEKQMNVALDLAIISKTDWKFDFDRMKTVEDCENPNKEDTNTGSAPEAQD